MENLYQLRIDASIDDDGNTVSSYGITVLKIEESIPNLFRNEDEAREFISLCNNEKVEYIHLHNVIEDKLINA